MLFHVVDSQSSQPIAGVRVRTWVAGNLVTDPSGTCSFALPKPTTGDFSYRITISKDGYVAKTITWSKSRKDNVEDIPTDYTAKMELAASIGGVLRSQDGQPVANARIIFSGLDNSPTLEREKTTVAPNYMTVRTDDNGQWKCNLVPQHFQDMLFRVDQPGYLPAVFSCEDSESGGDSVTRLPPADLLTGVAVMVLQRGIDLSGIITDNSGKPVPGAVITRNHEWRNPGAVLNSDDSGAFKISNLHPGSLILTIQAQGLEPQTVAVSVSNGMPEVKVAMNPAKVFKGRVLDQSGTPVAGATIQMDREDFAPLEFDWSATTDNDGGFAWDSAPAGPHPYLVSASGYNLRSEPALAAEDGDNVITLHKTSDKIFIDGKVTDAATRAPVANLTVTARVANGNDQTNWVQPAAATAGAFSLELDQHATAFTIEFRAPGYLPLTTPAKTPGDGDQRFDVQLEKGIGWRLAGRFAVPAYSGKINWKAGQSIVLTADVPDPDMPAFDNEQAKDVWMQQFTKTSAGVAWRRAQRSFNIVPDPDGSFQCEDVPPGNYQLRVRLRESADLGGGPLAALATNLVIAEASAGETAPARDLGLITLPAAANLKPGDAAPLFVTKTVDGHDLKLADYRGKYVLLDFWATWCGPCVAEMPNLKAVYEKHGQQGLFAMISLSMDAEPAQPIDFARKNGIRWTQGFLGDGDKSPVPGLYGVEAIPQIFLIGPDGKIIARDLRGPDIEQAISKALGAF